MRSIPLSLHLRTSLFSFIFFTSFLFLTFFLTGSYSADAFNSSQSLVKGQTLVSSNGVFQLGFFTLDNSCWYVGIWYKNIPETTYVWVANRDSPLRNSSSGVLRIGDGGNLVILEGSVSVIWSTNLTAAAKPISPVAQLLDSGNLVVREASDDPNGQNFLWQSFDFPTDTLLPDMKLGWDLNSGLNRYLTSWKSETDPSTGDYTFKINLQGIPEAFLEKEQQLVMRSGPWNGFTFTSIPEMRSGHGIYSMFISDQSEVYYSYLVRNRSIITRLTMNSTTNFLQKMIWSEDRKSWILYLSIPKDRCDSYSVCGPNGLCDINTSPMCNCTFGFRPANKQGWDINDWSSGCVRRTGLSCFTDRFQSLMGINLPDNGKAYVDKTMSLEECQQACARNCSCTAFSNANINDGETGCVMWTGELLSMRQDVSGGQDMYVRLAASDISLPSPKSWKNSKKSLGPARIALVTAASGALILGLTACFIWKCKRLRSIFQRKTQLRGTQKKLQTLLKNKAVIASERDLSGEPDELDLPQFDFKTIAQATDNFSDQNKLGKGGFGCVYKGTLEGRLEIAVKRLSANTGSGQGIKEFRNEVKLIARLQHINLVRLLGCCIEIDEKMLIYEFMEHKSLDSMLFDKSKSSILNWPRRLNIICGTARGLLYLHQDSRFRIIHRDLKASNILLDQKLNPKISDFGMARIFGQDQVEANTRRVVGTYGYMSPEYAMDGLFSVKSDIFSFGVSVLEIISGNKNKGFYYDNNELNLLGHAWKLWKEGKAIELLDPSVGASYPNEEVLRCIQVGLLCVQEHAEDRPVMSNVVLMLGSETAAMPQPKNPGFCLGRNVETHSSPSQQDKLCSLNQLTVTTLHGR